MAVPTVMSDLSTTIATNVPAGSEARSSADDYLRALSGIMRRQSAYGSDIASSGTITPDALASSYNVTGTTTITTIASTNSWDGRELILRFTGALTFTHSSTLVLPSAANITTAAGDHALMRQRSSGTWDCVVYMKASGLAIAQSVPTLTQIDANWSFDGSHRLLNGGNTQPKFRARRITSNQTSAVAGRLIYNSEYIDHGSNHDATTGIFTAPVAGFYTFYATALLANTTGSPQTGQIAIANITDSTYAGWSESVTIADSTSAVATATGGINAAASDQIAVLVVGTSLSSTFTFNTSTISVFSGLLHF